MRELVLNASVDLLDTVLDFIDAQLEEAGCPSDTRTLIAIASEEVYVNIANYAYMNADDKVSISCTIEKDPPQVTLRFSDTGSPYDPLMRDDPDITLGTEDRPVGGLGIYMVKEMMDSVSYEYKDGKNILTVIKKF